MTSLFTNIPLRKTVNIILDRVYKQKLIDNTIQKCTLKKLLIDARTKTPFFINNDIYKQIDSVAMRSPLAPTLADILMTQLEQEIIKPLIASDTIKFYARYVDETLVLGKPTDIPNILRKLNSW